MECNYLQDWTSHSVTVVYTMPQWFSCKMLSPQQDMGLNSAS